jgi:hypothetical protein
MVVNVALDLFSDCLDLLVDSRKDRFYGRSCRRFCGLQPVVLHVLQPKQIIQALDESLQGDDLIGWWCPSRRVVHLAVPGNKSSIGLVRFGARKLCFAKGMDLGGIDHAHQEFLMSQEPR